MMWTGGILWERGRVVDGAEKGVIEIELANGSIPGRKERGQRERRRGRGGTCIQAA